MKVKELGKYELSVMLYGEHESPYTVTCKNGAKPEKTVVFNGLLPSPKGNPFFRNALPKIIFFRTESDEVVDEEVDEFKVQIDGPVEITEVKPMAKGNVPTIERRTKYYKYYFGCSYCWFSFCTKFLNKIVLIYQDKKTKFREVAEFPYF
jgi:hypothetical protein